MANNYFQFKHFTVNQEHCAMKVCTDSCILGAFAAAVVSPKSPANILDIGCGTGLLSLMLAQKTSALIDAVEISDLAAAQAADNFRASPWHERLQVFNCALQDFKSVKKYDAIICNPPFYENDLRSPIESINAARHDTSLTVDVMLDFMKDNLNVNGLCFILLPYYRESYLESEANSRNLWIREKLVVRQTIAHQPFRSVVVLSQSKTDHIQCNELVIHDSRRAYTTAFKQLLQDYYLHL